MPLAFLPSFLCRRLGGGMEILILMKKTNLAIKRKIRYGIFSVVITALVIAAVIALNLIFSAFASKFNWTVDLTDNQLYKLSDDAKAELDTMDKSKTVEVIFCASLSTMESNSNMKNILELVKDMCANYSAITYKYVDPLENPRFFNKYTEEGYQISTKHIIVECKETGEYRVFKSDSMFIYDSDGKTQWGFNGEQKLISAMLQVTAAEKMPLVYFTNTHGEVIDSQLLSVFVDAGFSADNIKTIDLTKEDFDKDGRILVIANPLYDFQGISDDTAGIKSEIEKIDEFLDNFGSLIVFSDPDTQELPELAELLEEWGIKFGSGVVKDPDSSLDAAHYAISAQYSTDTDENGELYSGGALVKTMAGLSSPPKTIVKYTRPIELLWQHNDLRFASTVLYSSDNAELYVDGEKSATGKFPLMTISYQHRDVENTDRYSYVIAIGSKYFASSSYLGRGAYGNSDILTTAIGKMSQTQVPLELDFKIFDDESLSITTAQANKAQWLLMLVLPIVLLVLGICVWIRRKHK